MGIIQHDALVLTVSDVYYDRETNKVAWDKTDTKLIDHLEALAKFCGLEKLILRQKTISTNYTQTLIIVPDGSKEGWDESDKYEQCRAAFLAAIQGFKHDFYLVTVSYGECDLSIKDGWETPEE